MSTLLTNLISYWKLDEASGNAVDSHGSNTGTNIATTPFSAGKINNGALLNGTTQGFDLWDAPFDWIDWNVAFSINLWAKHDYSAAPGGGAAPNFFGKQVVLVSPYPGFQFGMTNRTASELNLDLQFLNDFSVSGKGFTVRSVNMLPFQNVWKMVTLTYDGSGNSTGVKMYLDGVSQTMTAVSASTTINATIGNNKKAAIGAANADDGVNHFKGMLDEVGVWDKTLTASEVTELYNGGAGLSYPFTSTANTGAFFAFF